jgi:hypothetical protein
MPFQPFGYKFEIKSAISVQNLNSKIRDKQILFSLP